MRILIGTGTLLGMKSKIIADTKITIKEELLLDFPVPANKIRVSLVKDNKSKALVLLFD